jgi:transcriptional regulator with XRE-family HTH domain
MFDVNTIVKEALEKKRWNYKELAEATGFTPGHINNLLHGHKGYTEKTIKILFDALGVKIQVKGGGSSARNN